MKTESTIAARRGWLVMSLIEIVGAGDCAGEALMNSFHFCFTNFLFCTCLAFNHPSAFMCS